MENLDRWDRLGLLKEWELEYVRLERVFKDLKGVFGDLVNSELFGAMWGNFDKYSEMLERVLGDGNQTLRWFWLDNEMGKKGLGAIVDGVEKKVEGLKELLWLIGEGEGDGDGNGADQDCKTKQ